MSHSSDVPQGNFPAADAADPDSPDGQSRGLFSRLREVFQTPDAATSVVSRTKAAADAGLGNLRSMRVEDVAIPKGEIVAVPLSIDKDALVTVFRESGLTRLPVYEDSLDNAVGLVNLKDFALRYGFGDKAEAFDLRAMIRPLLFVPPSMVSGVLLRKMQAERIHMALVIDEFGGTDGLITIEDLVETVVGDIGDEHDEEEVATFTRETDGVYLVKASTDLDDFHAEIGRDLTAHEEIDEEEIDTLGGLVFLLAGRVPTTGDVIRHPEGPEFEVLEADPRRIHRLRVRLPQDWLPRIDA